ncbi:Altered inheritance of mitochondria protein 44 [Maudiozyma exigua]|uniref:Altered inheritance of mitochondria protein 44 n=1 Tax=Maudiozyma exigua TaxID=34358 RepID=A0A9P6WGG3_MAUEX|nr:Altered inheritance of mitochondria protein 44 [Kazachstania exigua]
MIIRTPTRTKTKSFNGTQVDFKFPSTESLPRSEQKNEIELNNHHLLNVQLNSKNHLDIAGRSSSQVSSTHHDSNDDNVSQILSDYTSASNTNSNGAYTNSSNGYYSFANISDNTTSPRFFADNKDGPVSSLNLVSPNKFGNYPMTLAPDKSATSSPSLTGKRSNNSLRSSILSKGKSSTGSQMASIPENKSVSAHTVNASIPTADNISYEIVSATSNIEQSQPRMVSTVSSSSSDSNNSEHTHVSSQLNKTATVKKHPMAPTTNKMKHSKRVTTATGPILKPTRSVSRKLSTSRRITSVSSSMTPKRNRKSQLKRSNAIRCKGGLLAYFTSLGIKVKRTLKKLRIVIRKNIFFFNNGHGTVGHRTVSQSNKGKSNPNGKKLHKSKHNVNYSTSTRNGLTTSHLKRTDGYVTNLRRTISQSSRKSSLSKPITKSTPTDSISDPSASSSGKKISPSRTTLRRTNSSIRRAASILTATPTNNRFSTVIDPSSTSPVTTFNSLSNSPNPTYLTRSNGMSSLNSVIREPSIVVKNKVIPLSMNAYTIKEEDEYVIDTNSMYKRNSITGSESDSNSSYFESNHEKSSIYSENETDDSDYEMDDEKMTPEALAGLFNNYYRSIISKRIMMRLQMGDYNDSSKLNGEYIQLLEKFISEYESDSSDIFDNEDRTSKHDSISSSSDDDSNSQFSFNTTDENSDEKIDIITPLEKHGKNDIKIQFESPFGMYSQNASLLSIPTDAVKRSLTLPIGINI